MNKLTVTEAAEFSNVTPRTLYRHLKVGNITGTRIPNTNQTKTDPHPFKWLIDKESLETYYYQVTPGKKQHTYRRNKDTIQSKVRWINVYPKNDIDPYLFASKKEAMANADVDVIATKAIQVVF